MVDRVKPLKIETASTGTEEDEFPTEANPAEDFLDIRGVALQRHTGPGETDHTNDEKVLFARDAFDRMTFVDDDITTTKTLRELMESSVEGFIYNCKVSWVSVSSIQIGAGRARSDDNDEDIVVSSPITVSITSSGANGLDTGSEASSTWYYVWVIKNSTTEAVAGLLSASSTSPTMPSGYDKKRRLGAIKNNGSSNLLRFFQRGNGTTRKTLWNETPWVETQVLSGGSSAPFTDVSCATVIPPTSEIGYFFIVAWYGNAGIRPNGSSSSPQAMVESFDTGYVEMATDSSQIIEYYANDDPQAWLDIHVMGYIEEL